MSENKYIISFTTIPTRLKNIHLTIDSLLNQIVMPEKIILNMPKIYSLRFKTSVDIISVNELLKKYQNKIIINYLDEDYGPGTKLLGLLNNNIIDINWEKKDLLIFNNRKLIHSSTPAIQYSNKVRLYYSCFIGTREPIIRC